MNEALQIQTFSFTITICAIIINVASLPFQSLNEQLENVQAELQQEMKNVCSLKARVSELEVRPADLAIHSYLVQ